MVTKAGEEKNEVLFNSAYSTLVREYEKVLEMDTDNSCTTMPMLLMPLNCTFKND